MAARLRRQMQFPRLTLVAREKVWAFFDYQSIDQTKLATLPPAEIEQLTANERVTKQHALAKIAILPVIMCVCYLGLIVYFRSRGGYQAQVLSGHAADDKKFTGGTVGPGEG